MEIKRLRNLALKIFKTINDLNPSFIKSIFLAKLNARVRLNDILVKTCKSATFGDKSLGTLGPKIWTALQQNKKVENSYVKFKEYIATWFGPSSSNSNYPTNSKYFHASVLTLYRIMLFCYYYYYYYLTRI